MGAWGYLAFDNDTANDWACGLDDVTDLSLVESALDEREGVGAAYLEQDTACTALAACEVLARCRTNAGYKNSYTEKVDAWVAKQRPEATPALLKRAVGSIDRILSNDSELRELWEESDEEEEWRDAIADLRERLRT